MVLRWLLVILLLLVLRLVVLRVVGGVLVLLSAASTCPLPPGFLRQVLRHCRWPETMDVAPSLEGVNTSTSTDMSCLPSL